MKKYVIIALVLVLTLTLMAGCRGNSGGETATPSDSGATILPTDMMPDSTNGNATDGDGFIDGGTGSNGQGSTNDGNGSNGQGSTNGGTGNDGMDNRGRFGIMPNHR